MSELFFETVARGGQIRRVHQRDGVALAYDKVEGSGQPLVFIHGWCCDRTYFAPQVAYFAAREKDADHRCDLEAGMAKLLAAQVAWSAADNAVQIHGGNGYALEYPISRIFCDARILNIFEGAAEIQAQIIGRRLLGL